MRLLSAAKMNLLPLEGLSVNVSDEHLPFGPVFLEYLRLTAERAFMNYDDMIYQAVRILLDNDPLRGVYQERYRYLLIDEFQDLNRAQILLLRILAFPENNLFIVGDDDQLIYGWRGACVRSIIDFPRAHPCASECILSTNYRSPVSIVEHAGWLISKNAERVPKTVNPRPGAPRGGFEIRLGAGLWEQARSASEWIMGKKEGHRWGDSAVLFRYNALRFVIALALDVRGIPHSVAEEIHLFESRAGKDVMAWLEVVLRPGSIRRDALARILRRPSRVLRRSLIDGVGTWHDVESLPGTSNLTDAEDSALRRLLSRVAHLRQKAPLLCASELIEEIDRTICLRPWYTRSGRAGPDPDESDDATYLDVIGAVSRAYPAGTDFLAHVEALRSSPLESPSASEPAPGRDEVVLSTIHRAKGKEFDHVVVFDLSRRHRLGRDEIEEERRVAYVALTRAKESLLLTASGRRQSPFLRESALNPEFAGRMREDMESELRGLRGRLRRLPPGKGESLVQTRTGLLALIDALEEELRCRSMISMPSS
jgi:DNA helicase-2/ATP-dependent DNA helicase PcrA